MPRQNNRKSDERRKTLERAAIAHIGWNVGQELWAWGLDAIKFLGFIFLLFCIFPILYGLFLVIDGPSHPEWQSHSHTAVQEIGFGFIVIGAGCGFLTYLLLRALRMAARWFARKARY